MTKLAIFCVFWNLFLAAMSGFAIAYFDLPWLAAVLPLPFFLCVEDQKKV